MTDSQTVYDLFCASAQQFGERPFLHAPAETASRYNISIADYTYNEVANAVGELKNTYSDAGIGPGMRVGLAFENRPAFFLHFLAINSLGGSILPLNSAMQRDELAYQIDHSECVLIVAVDSHADMFRGIASNLAKPIAVVSEQNLSEIESLRKNTQALADTAAEREAAIVYTSGTTGKPKGCLLSNEYFIGIAEFYTTIGGLCTFELGVERILTPLPVSHMNALACSFMAAVRTGACLIQLDRFHPRSWWKTVRQSRPTIIHYLGVMPAMLLQFPSSPQDDFKNQVKFAFGAGCDPRHHERFETRFGFPLVESWAMTETGSGAWITASHEPRQLGERCFGKAPTGLEYKLINEDGTEAMGDTPGELLVRRKGDDPRRYFFSTYYKDPVATEEAWSGGWFHTGDVVRVDQDGYFYFVDRRKNVIRRSGENIAAIEVESVLMRHDGVANCVVVPVPDEIRGDEVAALIVSAVDQDTEKFARSVFDYAMDNLAYFKAPGYIGIVNEIPLTASEKVKRGDAKMIGRKMVHHDECYNFIALKKQRRT